MGKLGKLNGEGSSCGDDAMEFVRLGVGYVKRYFLDRTFGWVCES